MHREGPTLVAVIGFSVFDLYNKLPLQDKSDGQDLRKTFDNLGIKVLVSVPIQSQTGNKPNSKSEQYRTVFNRGQGTINSHGHNVVGD